MIALSLIIILSVDVLMPVETKVSMWYRIPIWLTVWTSNRMPLVLVGVASIMLSFIGFFLSFLTIAASVVTARHVIRTRGTLERESAACATATDNLRTLSVTLEQHVPERTRELEETRVRLSAILETTHDPIAIVNEAGRIMFVNAQTELLFGYRREEILGQSVEVLISERFHKAHQRHRAHSRLCEPTYPVMRLDLFAQHQDGHEFPIEISLGSLEVEGERFTSITIQSRTDRQDPEAALKVSEERLRLALEAAHMGIWDWNLETNAVTWSDRAKEILGLGHEPVAATHQVYLNLVHPDDREIVDGSLSHCLRTGAKYNIEHRISSPDGTERWVACHADIVHDRDAHPVRMVGTIMDITVRKRMDATLAEREARLRAILDHSPNMIFLKDTAGHYLDVNRQFEHCFHIACEQIRGLTDEQIFPSQQAASFRANDLRVLEAGIPLQFEEIALHDDGPHTSIVFKFALRHADGTPYALCGITTDITERKRTEEALRLSTATFRSAFEYAAIGKALVAPDGRWLQVNRSLCELVGYSEPELLGLTFQAITHPEDLEADLGYVGRMLAGEIRTYQMEKRYFHKQGHIVWILLNVSLVRDPDGHPLYFISEMQDITDRKRIEEALRDSKRKLQDLLDARERLARNLHDNTIQSLFAIGMGLEESNLLIKEGSPQATEKLQAELERLQRVIREVRRYITTTQQAPTDTRLLMQELEDLAEDMVSGRDYKVEATCDAMANEQVTSEQSDHMICIAREAISNAVRHSGGCSCSVSVSLVGGLIRLVVEDNGNGFDIGQVAGHSSGLGLSNIKARAQQLHADLQITSRREVGTRISLEIPVRKGIHDDDNAHTNPCHDCRRP